MDRLQRWLTDWTRPRGALAGFVLLAALFYLPILLGIRTFPDGDFTHHFLPFSLFQQRELLAGRLPLWNPYTYAGHPFLADVQAAVFYPISNLLLVASAFWRSPAARLYFLEIEAIIQIALAGFFSYLLLRKLTGSGWAAWTGGALFALSGFLTGYPPVQLAILRTAIWLPLLLWLLLRAAERPRVERWLAVGAAGAAATLAGHPQTLLLLAYVVAAWSALLISTARGRRKELTVGLLVALLAMLGLSAVQLLPSLEFARLSVRADVSYAFVSGGFPLQDTWQTLLPGVLTVYSPLYIGVVGLGLAMVALAASGHLAGQTGVAPIAPRTAGRFFALLALLALLLSFGDNGFLYPIVYHIAPGWKLFRGQERTAYLVAFGLSMLAGLGAAALPTLAPRVRLRLALQFGATVVAGVYAFGMIWQLPGATAVSNGRYLLVAAVTLLLGMGFSLLVRLEGWDARRSLWLTALAVVNLLWANAGVNLDAFSPARKAILAPEMAALADALASETVDTPGVAGRVYNEFRLYEDYGMRQEIEDIWGSSPLRLARYAALFDDFPLDRLWDLTGVTHVLTWRKELFEPSTLLAEFPQQSDTTYLHRLQTPNERAWVACRVALFRDDQILTPLAAHEFDLRRTALVAPEDAPNGLLNQVGGCSDETDLPAVVTLKSAAPGVFQIHVENGGRGVLVVSENWLPGWSTTPARPLFRTNLSFIGVQLPGDEVVDLELRYQPTSLHNGLRISGFTLLAIAVALGTTWRRRRTEPVR